MKQLSEVVGSKGSIPCICIGTRNSSQSHIIDSLSR